MLRNKSFLHVYEVENASDDTFQFPNCDLGTSWDLLRFLTNQASTNVLLIHQRRNDITTLVWKQCCHDEHFYLPILSFSSLKAIPFLIRCCQIWNCSCCCWHLWCQRVRWHNHRPVSESSRIIFIIRSDEFMRTLEIHKPWLAWVKRTAHRLLFLCNHQHSQGFSASLPPLSVFSVPKEDSCEGIYSFFQAGMAFK